MLRNNKLQAICYGLYLDVPSKSPVFIGRIFGKVATSWLCDTGLKVCDSPLIGTALGVCEGKGHPGDAWHQPTGL